MAYLVATSSVYRTPKSGPLTEMTGYDDDGNAIVRATSEMIKPGEFFEETNEAEAIWLIANDGAREATASEREAYERTQGK